MVTDRTESSPLLDFLELTSGISDMAPLSEAKFMDRMVGFANARDQEQLHALETELVSGLKLDEPPVFFYPLQVPLTPKLCEIQERLRKSLDLIRNTPREAPRLLENELRQAGDGIAIRPSYVVTSAGVEVLYRYYPVNLEAALGYGLVLLLDKERPYGKGLCRCRLGTCDQFFLAIRPTIGRPRRDYCCKEHLAMTHNRDSADRVRLHRERKAAEKAKPRRRRRL